MNRSIKMVKKGLILASGFILCGTLLADPWADVQSAIDSIKPQISGSMPVVDSDPNQAWFSWEKYGRKAMHLGNGDMGIACGSTDSEIEYHLTSNEFGGLIGRIYIMRQSGSGTSGSMSASHEMNMKNGEVLITGKVSSTQLETQAYVPYKEGLNHKNYLVINITNRDSLAAPIKVVLEPDATYMSATNALSQLGSDGSNLIWGKRQTAYSLKGLVNWRASYCAKLVGMAPSSIGGNATQKWLNVTLAPGQSVQVVVNLMHESGYDGLMPTLDELYQDAKANIQAVTDTTTLRADHLNWWKNYWLLAHANFNDTILNGLYYGALYNMGVSTRPHTAPPGLQGLFKHTGGYSFGHQAFAPDLHFLNYNYESSFYAYHNSNRIEQFKNYAEAMFCIYQQSKYGTAADAQFQGVGLQARWSYQGTGNVMAPESAKQWAGTSTWGWDFPDDPVRVHNFRKMNTQKSLGALFAINIVKSYLYSEDMSILDYTAEYELSSKDSTDSTRGLSVYQLIVSFAEFFEDYLTTECKDALNPDGSFALNPDGSRREWQASDGDNYVYRMYDSWAREPEKADLSCSPFPRGNSDNRVRPRDYLSRRTVNGVLLPSDQDSANDIALIRYLFRGLIKISSDRSDTTKHAAWKDILDHMVDYATTANSPSFPTYSGNDVYKECYSRPEINYNSQGRHTYIGTMMPWAHSVDECRYGSPEAAMARDTFHEVGLWQIHEEYNIQNGPTASTIFDSKGNRVGTTLDATNTLCPTTENDYLTVMTRLFNDWNNYANLYPMLVRSFYDGERIIEFLHYEYNAPNLIFHKENLLTDNGPEGNSIVEALNDMLVMSHLSPNSGNGATDLAEGHYIMIFPVWPKTRDASFHEILARGAFLVSAEQKSGEVMSCSIKSNKGNRCRLFNPWPGDGVRVFDGTTELSTRQIGDIFSFNTIAGKTYRIEKGTPKAGVMARMSVSATKVAIPATITFTLSASTGPITVYELDVDGNGTTDYTGPGPHTHTFTTGGTYLTQITVKDSSGHSDRIRSSILAYSDADLNGIWPLGSGSGTAMMETWNGVNHWTPDTLPSFTNTAPDAVEYFTEFRMPNASRPDAPGHRISARVHIPVTGNYTFYTTGGPAAKLFGDMNGTRNNLTLLASSSGGGDKVYTAAAASNPIALTVGDTIYLELHQAQNSSWGHASAGWSTDHLPVTVIAGEHLSPYGTITNGPPPNQPPTPRIYVDRTAGYAPQSVTFDAFDSFDTDGSIATYTWDFDGNGSTDSTQILPTHTYTQGGMYQAKLTVTDDDGDAASSTVQPQVAMIYGPRT